MPFTFEKLGNVRNKKILDLGCGEGGYSRHLAREGAIVTGIDCSTQAIDYCKENKKDLQIEYFVRNSNDLEEIENNSFDIVLCSMMLMDCEDLDGTIKEISRVIKEDGYVFASVLHPCFNSDYKDGIGRQGIGPNRQVYVNNYFEPKTWEAPLNKGKTPVIWHHRLIEEYVKTFYKYGLVIIDLDEPRSTTEQANSSNAMEFLHRIPLFLFMKLIKVKEISK